MIIKFKGEIETEVELEVIFEAFKKFAIENFHNYRFYVSNDKETISDSFSRKEL